MRVVGAFMAFNSNM